MKKLLSTILLAMLIVTFEVSEAAQSFEPADVPQNHSARYAVVYVVNREILVGYGDRTFRGDRLLTRYEMATALGKILDDTYKRSVPKLSTAPFTDVPEKHWARDAVFKLAALKILEGYGDHTFRGDRFITRYEAAMDAYRLVMTISPNAVPASYDCNFSDVPQSHWAYPMVRMLSYFGGMGEGYGDNTFRGDRLLTRYEAAVLFCQLNNFLINNPRY